ncbi:hypothetical protein VNO77_35973 [Canavalia gladiata]|uniref:Uncharacterized protein n=1 Tax=Canavalia gladiata TaxID=3824 RepID=A0AAN9PVY6_CANGL
MSDTELRFYVFYIPKNMSTLIIAIVSFVSYSLLVFLLHSATELQESHLFLLVFCIRTYILVNPPVSALECCRLYFLGFSIFISIF